MNIYSLLTNLGIKNEQDKSEQKNIRMINVISILWYHALILTSFASYIVKDDSSFALTVNFCGFLVVLLCQFLNTKGHTSWAAFLLMIFSASHYLMISCFIASGRFVEFFYLIIPSTTLMLFKKTWQSIIILCFCIVLFHIPFIAFDFYEKEGVLFISPLMVFLFVTVFLIVLYFKLQNEKNETLLNQEKQKAIDDRELIETQKMELEELNNFKNKFFVNVSHELRTPITLIDGFASHIVRDKETDHIPHVEKILDQSSKMKVVVDQILDLSKMKLNMFKLNIVEINLTEILQKIHASFLPLFREKGIIFSLNTPDFITIKADPIYIERALNNLVLNSLKYTENGQVELLVKEKSGSLLILVSDTGIGIKSTDIDKISQEFYQAENDINHSGGSGIGLSFAKNIVELHNGTLEIESEWGKGTQVCLKMNGEYSSLPQSFKTPKEVKPIEVTSIKQKTVDAKPTILIVEDHTEMTSYLNLLLSNDYHLLHASNGLEALPMLSTEKVDFILTDYMMPKMNGGELITEIRKQGYVTPVIVLTARTDIGTKLDTLRMGIDDYLHKPFNSDELLIKIQNRLSNFQERNTIEESETPPITTSVFIVELSKYVEENCSEYSFKIEDICHHVGLSESSLYRKVKSETGLSPKALIKEVRLLKARRLLEKREVSSIKELVSSVGIKNKTYFDKQYFERFGSHLKDLID